MSKKMPLVLVEWDDAHGSGSWMSLNEVAAKATPLKCRSVGWLVTKKNGHHVLTTGLSGENSRVEVCGDGHMSIPNGMIRKVTVLRKNG